MADNQSSFNAPNPPDDNGADNDGLNAGMPKVSAAPGKIFFVIGGIVSFVLVIVWMLSGSGDKKPVADEVSAEPKKIATEDEVPAPQPPPPAEPIAPPRQFEPLPITVPPPGSPEAPIVDDGGSYRDDARQQRLRSEMLVLSGAAPRQEGEDNTESGGNDPNSGFASRASRATKAATAKAGNMGNLNVVIGQGKLIHAVLETAINTTLPGAVRAIVSRDTYAESGKNILIPKGSRLIGTYNTNLLQGQKRVFIIWQRVIRPDGVDIFVNSPAVDSLGRAGGEGYVDNRLQQIFTGAIMTSIVSLGVAYASEQVLGAKDSTETTNTDGSSTKTSSPVTEAANQATESINEVGKRVLDRIIDTRPLVTIDQGTKINVMLNRDLIFPADAAIGSARMVP